MSFCAVVTGSTGVCTVVACSMSWKVILQSLSICSWSWLTGFYARYLVVTWNICIEWILWRLILWATWVNVGQLLIQLIEVHCQSQKGRFGTVFGLLICCHPKLSEPALITWKGVFIITCDNNRNLSCYISLNSSLTMCILMEVLVPLSPCVLKLDRISINSVGKCKHKHNILPDGLSKCSCQFPHDSVVLFLYSPVHSHTE